MTETCHEAQREICTNPGMAARHGKAGKERQTMKQRGNAVPARHGALMEKDDWKAFFQKITI
ncbi:hypothetical protein [Herbaspirillum chlorophenolicum]|uniref:hypothetical protein n=1 Tax=Herbaspirillum chlorophenolicum TaxID=211589 RepID=UPI0012E29E64|nr:hypothetical protein [Herbaspirillum chlorophenolicum]